MIPIAPVVILRNLNAFSAHRIRFFAIGGAVWAGSQILSDLYNDIPSHNAGRGLAAIAMTLLGVLVFYALFAEKQSRLWWYVAGTVPSAVYLVVSGGTSINGNQMVTSENAEVWDLVVVPIATPVLLLCGAAFAKRSPFLVSLVFAAYGIAAITQQSRSQGLIFLLSGILYYAASRRLGLVMNLRKAMLVSAPFLLAGFLSYVHLGLKGDLGRTTATQLRVLKQPYNPVYVLLSGRVALLVALDAIQDSPLLGHGSWAYKPEYVKLEAKYVAALGGEEQARFVNDEAGVIPAHSVILGAWVNGGVVGGLLWIWVAWQCAQILANAIGRGAGREVLFATNFALLSMWSLMFSPIGAVRGTWTAGFAFTILVILNAKRHSADGAGQPPLMRVGDAREYRNQSVDVVRYQATRLRKLS